MIQEHRDKLASQRRKQHLERIFKKQRQKLYGSHSQFARNDFESIYAIINESNYENYKFKLAQFVVNDNLTYQISIFGSLVYQYLIEHPLDSDSVKILMYISQFQDVQIPQTRQLAQILTQLAKYNLQSSLIISSNLLSTTKYQSIFRDRLFQQRYFQILDQQMQRNFNKISNQNLIIEMVAQLYCYVLSSQPLYNINKLYEIVLKLKKLTICQEAKWQILHTFSKIRQSLFILYTEMKRNKKFAELMLNQFEQLIISQIHGNQIHIFGLILYASLSDVYSKNPKIIQLLTNFLNKLNLTNLNVLNQCLQCLFEYMAKQKFYLQREQIVNLFNIFLIEPSTCSIIDENVLNILLLVNQQQLIQIIQQHQFLSKFVQKIIICLQNSQTVNKTIKFINNIFNYEEIGIKQKFMEYGGNRVLEKINNQNDCSITHGQIQNLFEYF